jgi:predicted DNA binding CopG/RHH family protein
MSKKISYEDEPVGNVTRVLDFLPPPSQLVPKEETVKVTLILSKKSIDFFKNEAQKNNVSYQQMLRYLVDSYVQRYS